MPPSPPTAGKNAPRKDSNLKKKTKSRNGCGRCKLKRLKCDETTPGCLQCKKRQFPCPGYEKTLKWSTKYEMFQPMQFEPATSPAKKKANTPAPTPVVAEIALPLNVVEGFEALAKVLPVGKRKPESELQSPEETETSPERLTEDTPAAAQEATPQESAPQEEDVLQQPQTPGQNLSDLMNVNVMDSAILDDCFQDSDMLSQDFSFDQLDSAHLLEPSNLDDLDLDVEEIDRPASDALVEPGSSRLSRSLLLDFYRLPSPSPSTSSLDDIESVLVQHYFKDVCVIYSSFDSIINPFRTSVGRVFQDSPSIYYAIQSMAAAHLANSFPNMTAIGMDMQRKACEALQTELPLVQSGKVSGGRTFLSIILLGLTKAWHESSALGEEFLTMARSLILPKLLDSSEDEVVQRQNQFFEESLIYWEMLMGFVTQDSMSFSSVGMRARATSTRAGPASRRPDGKIVPHPWTGVAPTVQFLFAEVGRLIRKERILQMGGTMDIRSMQENLLNAATLEEDLLAAEYPTVEDLADPGDERTSKHDFIVMAEAYRCAGLLEIYSVFPSILRKRLGTDKFSWTANVDFEFPTPRFETPYEDTDIKLWLNSLALHILSALETVPASSGTCCLQPLLFVAAASELKFVSSVDYFDMYANDVKVMHARDFAEKRLHEYALRLPAKPLRKIIGLVKEVWRRLDDGNDTFWVDVMIEKGWHTIMG